MELILVCISIVGLYYAFKSYSRLKGYILMEFAFAYKDSPLGDIESHLYKGMEELINAGYGKALEDSLSIRIDMKNIGYQAVTIESIYLRKIVFVDNYKNSLITSAKSGHEEYLENKINTFLKGRSFKEINMLILLNEKESAAGQESFIDDKDSLHVKVNDKPITINRLGKHKIDFSEYVKNNNFKFEGKEFSYIITNIYCYDTLGRGWELNNKSLELLRNYSIGTSKSYF